LSYKNLEIWQEARALVIDIHKMTLEKLSGILQTKTSQAPAASGQ
jgi:hypothetical protein